MQKILIASAFSLTIFFALGTFLVSAATPTGTNSNPASTGTNSNPSPTGTNSNPTPTGTNSNPATNLPIEFKNPFRGGDTLFDLLQKVINVILLPIGGILAVLAFIYSGFLYVTAQGNETKLGAAHQALLYTAIGTAVLLGSWVLANVVCKTIGQLGSPVICPTQNLPSSNPSSLYSTPTTFSNL